MRFIVSYLTLFCCLFLSNYSEAGRIRLRKVKDAPKTCTVMKEDPTLSRADKKVLGTEKNSLIIDEQITLVGDLGQKQCIWPAEKFIQFGELKKINFYIDEYKNILVAYQKNETINGVNSVQQIQINADNCQFDELKTLTQVNLPKCEVPRKFKKTKKTKKITTNKPKQQRKS